MLNRLLIRDFVIASELELSLTAGLSVFTGETGAGKSLLVDALSLLLGERADSTMVRHGKERADISGEFTIAENPPARDWLKDAALDSESDSVLVRRTVDADGKSRAWINGTPTTVQQLKAFGEYLVDIHGQHAHQSLLRRDSQRHMLDAYAGADTLLKELALAWRDWQTAKQALQDADAQQAQRAEALERLEWRIRELTPVAIPTEEWAQLQSKHRQLSHAATLLAGLSRASGLLSDADDAILGKLNALKHELAALAEVDDVLGDTLRMIDSAEIELVEATHSLRRYAEQMDLDESSLQALDEQISAALSVARKLNVAPENLQAALVEAEQKRQAISDTQNLDALQAAVTTAQMAWTTLAAQLTHSRQTAAAKLEQLVTGNLQRLAMGGTTFSIQLAPDAPGPNGAEHIEYQIQHGEQHARALAKIASGGELSRISLAIQVSMSAVASVPSLVFDEVDVGIGGGTAEVVGQLLQELGWRFQVLCVTHQAQVAACGDHHWQVSKTDHAQGLQSQVALLDPDRRIMEVARMLGGVELTPVTVEHARELLNRQTAPSLSI